MRLGIPTKISAIFCVVVLSAVANAELMLTSPVMENGGTLPADLKCTRDGGDGLSPPIDWTGAPEGTKSFAVVMHHYPANRVEGIDNPSHYWLVWNIPASTSGFPRGNPESIGNEGGDKDKRYIGYTPPCSPGNAAHEYTITVYALDSDTIALGAEDDINVDWAALIGAIEGRVIASSSLDFIN
ncbi:MAG: YbhB/YbcL family Raf kinase inhibitor-like protein [Porticoccaceae bacterium]|jgi:Raf kinase inhibitor-like YbhB/YbcL family protein|nr:YbhB/YbcL family Raf kinase inhibitor-like protein [Porticoccaceae bacterium]